MKRTGAIFPGSRLYRQAENGAADLLFRCRNASEPFGWSLRRAFDTDELTITSASEAKAAYLVARSFAEAACEQIDPYFALPVFMQTAVAFYYGDKDRLQPWWAGTAAKAALAVTWPNIHRGQHHSRALSSLEKALYACALAEQLEFVNAFLQARPDLGLRFDPEGLVSDTAEATHALNEHEFTFKNRGAGFRTLSDTRKLMHAQDETIQSVISILKGDDPRAFALFRGTLFEHVSATQFPNFWAEIGAHFLLMRAAAHVRLAVTDDPFGVSVVSDFAIPLPTVIAETLQNALFRKIWSLDWYRRYTRSEAGRLNNMIVERPALQLGYKPDLYVTSSILVADAFAAFVEDSVVDGGAQGGIKLPGFVFQTAVATRFEAQVAQAFIEQNWKAGSVTDRGIWHLIGKAGGAREFMAIEHPTSAPMPGEIDVLALDPSSSILIVIECKILARPYSARRIRNVESKLGTQDAASFHSTLRRKVDWVQSSNLCASTGTRDVRGVIVTDIVLTGMTRGKMPVVPFEALERWLEAGVIK